MQNLVSMEWLKLLPCALFVAWNLAYLSAGICAIEADWGLASTHCGQTLHIFKFCGVNLAFAFADFASYIFFPGGGEGARARATLVSAMYFAFFVGGMLIWFRLDGVCLSVLGGKSVEDYTMILTYHHVVTVYNGVMLVLVIFHEVYLGRKYGYDFTIRPHQAKGDGYFTDMHDAQKHHPPHHKIVQDSPFDGVQEVPPDDALPSPVSPKFPPSNKNAPDVVGQMYNSDLQNVYAVLDAQP